MNTSDPAVPVTFVDWIPGICSALGMLVINSIDKSRLSADSFSYSGNGVAWKARLILFLGFALMAGGLAGSVVRFYHGFYFATARLTRVIDCYDFKVCRSW